jgi:ferredoxin
MTTTIWIDEGCIACGACVDVAPEIFAMDAGDGCLIAGAARLDGKDTSNAVERSPLKPGYAEQHAAALQDAREGGPTECIKQQ